MASFPYNLTVHYHLIKLNDRMQPRQRPLRSVRRRIEERLLNEKRSRAFKELVDQIRGNAKVEIDEEALKLVSFDAVTDVEIELNGRRTDNAAQDIEPLWNAHDPDGRYVP